MVDGYERFLQTEYLSSTSNQKTDTAVSYETLIANQETRWLHGIEDYKINPLKPNDPYTGRTAPLTSKVAFHIFIQQIQVLNILNMVYTLLFFLFKMQFVSQF